MTMQADHAGRLGRSSRSLWSDEKGYTVGLFNIAEVRDWAREAGNVARHYFNNVTRTRKADHSWVTQADLEIEHLLRERIAARYPEHGMMGEEGGIGAIDREFVWSIDPIDGTGAFVSGLPLWSVSIGLLQAGTPYLGVVYIPLLDDYYWADAEGPAYRNDQVIMVQNAEVIDRSDWIGIPSHSHRSYRITFPGKARVLNSIAVDCCYVARGAAVGAVLGRGSLWDVAGGMAVLRAAGGIMATLSGDPIDMYGMLRGQKSHDTLIIGSPNMIERLRGCITRV